MKRKVQLSFVLLIISAVVAVDHRYCTLESCPNRTHTFCKYSHWGAVLRCGMGVRYGLRYTERQAILYLYSSDIPSLRLYERRGHSRLQSDGGNSEYLMQWDEELGEVAQRWANQCLNETDECRNVDRFRVRQRVGVVSSPRYGQRPSIMPLVAQWFSEDKLTPLNNAHFQNRSISEIAEITSKYFRQLGRRNANRVGCGAVRTFDTLSNYVYLVCNFGPA